MADPESDRDNPRSLPVPDGGWSERIETLADPIVVPPEESNFVQPAGILASDGSYCAHGALWRRHRPITVAPPRPETVTETLAGRWLWGGVLWQHFGHFLVESTSRLWALNALDRPVDGVLFIPKRPRVGDAVREFQRDFVSLLAPDLPIRVITAPTCVQELVVPGQGFGIGALIGGTRSFRDAMHARFAREIPADGPERLYISRSALGLGKGGLLGEERLEEQLVQQGYEIFHPEKHDLATQMARYKAATHVIAVDGSALHLFAMVGRPDQNVAMILRRKSGAAAQLATNVEKFCGRTPLVIEALHTEWVKQGKGRADRLSFGELDLVRAGKALAEGGFVAPDVNWPELTEENRAALFRDKGLGERGDYVESPEYERARIRRMRQDRRARRAARRAASDTPT